MKRTVRPRTGPAQKTQTQRDSPDQDKQQQPIQTEASRQPKKRTRENGTQSGSKQDTDMDISD